MQSTTFQHYDSEWNKPDSEQSNQRSEGQKLVNFLDFTRQRNRANRQRDGQSYSLGTVTA